MNCAYDRWREAMASMLQYLAFRIAGMTFLIAIWAVPKIPQETFFILI